METSLSSITFSSVNHWGPDPNFMLDEYKNLPFAPFNKLEKLGKFVDVTNLSGKPTVANVSGPVQVSNDNQGFIDVDVKPIKKSNKSKQPIQTQTVPFNKTQSSVSYGSKGNKSRPNTRYQVTRTKFKDTSGFSNDWEPIGDANKTNFEKTHLGSVKVEDICTIGSIPEYDKTWDIKLTSKKQAPFSLPSKITLSDSVRDDPIMEDIIKKDKDTEIPTIYCTDVILSALLTVKNAQFPWDLQMVKEGNQYFLEPADRKVNYIDILTVNENTTGNQPEDEKDMLKVCLEATNSNKKFVELTTNDKQTVSYSENDKNFGEVPEGKVYRYRRW